MLLGAKVFLFFSVLAAWINYRFPDTKEKYSWEELPILYFILCIIFTVGHYVTGQ